MLMLLPMLLLLFLLLLFDFQDKTGSDEVVLSKTVLLNFCPKQANEWIGGPRGSIIELFIAILT